MNKLLIFVYQNSKVMKNRELKETIYRNVYQNASEGYVLTPSELAFEMISTLPKSVFESETTTFLDPICKSGTFLFEIAEELYNRGHSIGNIEKRIYTIDNNSHSLNVANAYIKRILNRESGSFGVDFKSDFTESFFNQSCSIVSGGRFKTFEEFINTILINKKMSHLMVELKRNISEFIERYEKVSKLESKLFGEVFTPRQLIDEMLDTLPAEVWKNKDLKWLDPAVGIGNFPAAILDRLMVGLEDSIPNEDERRKWILEEMLFMCDISIKNLFLLYKLFDENNEFKLNVYRGSFLEEGFDKHMKEVWGLEGFDVVVGNPPYQDSDSSGKKKPNSDNLFTLFVKKSINICNENGYFLKITPPSWMTPSSQNSLVRTFLNMNLKHLNIFDSNKYFNVGSDFSWYLVQKCEYKNDTRIIFLNKTDKKKYDEHIDFSKYKLNFLPNIINGLSISILNKIMVNDMDKIKVNKDYILESRKPVISKIKDDIFIYENFHTGGKKLYSSIKHPNHDSIKVLISVSGYVNPIIDIGENGTTQGCFYILCDSIENAENIRNLFNSKLYRFIHSSICKWSGWNNMDILNMLPIVQINDDEGLYEHFNLTQEEIDLIEKTIKD